MHRRFISLFLCTVFIGTGLPEGARSQASEAANPLALQWDARHLKETVIPGQSTAEGWFTFTNVSGQTVQILDVESDCDCVVLQMDRPTYYPGESGVLIATIELKPGEDQIQKPITVRFKAGESGAQQTVLLLEGTRLEE